jgi:hypothetical protein
MDTGRISIQDVYKAASVYCPLVFYILLQQEMIKSLPGAHDVGGLLFSKINWLRYDVCDLSTILQNITLPSDVSVCFSFARKYTCTLLTNWRFRIPLHRNIVDKISVNSFV